MDLNLLLTLTSKVTKYGIYIPLIINFRGKNSKDQITIVSLLFAKAM